MNEYTIVYSRTIYVDAEDEEQAQAIADGLYDTTDENVEVIKVE
jgi:hypothetical protein